jgi:hypothetical protein
MGPDPASLRHQLEDVWRRKLLVARERYEFAAGRFQAALDQHGASMTSDSSLALQQARALESAAMKDYMNTLRIFSDLVLREKMPEVE